MKLATWNVNSLKMRLPRVLGFLAQHRPDIVCLQETKSNPDAFPHLDFAAAGYVAADHSCGRWAGVAVLAPEHSPPTVAARGLPGEVETGECRWIEADVAGVRVASVYVPNGRAVRTDTFAAKLAFLDAMGARAAQLAGGDAVIAGDLNVTRSDLDVYNPALFRNSTHVTPDERGRLESILSEGFVDAYRRLHPDEVGYTWWDYRAGDFHNHRGLRIDFALVSGHLADRLVTCGIDRSYRKGPKPSDHAPLLIELD